MKILAATTTAVIKQLVTLLKTASDFYYNSGNGDCYNAKPAEVPEQYRALLRTTRGEITDKVYNALEAELQRIKPDHPYLQMIGAPVKIKKTNMKLPFKMPSLHKIKTDVEIESWLAKNPGPYIVSDKVDGVSIGVKNTDKDNRLGFTRGNGTIGDNITYKLPYLGIPHLRMAIDLRGETVMPLAQFNSKWKRTAANERHLFKNARGMASGIVNTDELHRGLKDSKTIIYEVVSPRGVPSMQLTKLKTLGFNVVPFRVFNKLTPAVLKAYLVERRTKAHYEMDGLVITQNKKNPAPVADNPSWSVAYKDESTEASGTATVVKVEWNITRTGRLFPRIWIEPIQLGTITNTYLSGKSGKLILDNGIGPGAKIFITRAGDVIPDFKRTVKRVKPQMPDARVVGKWVWNGENIDLENREHDTAQLLNIEHFFATIGVDDFKSATISKFLDDTRFTDVPSFVNASQKQWQSVAGTNVNIGRVWQQMRDNLAGIQLSTLMYASYCFGRAMGSRRFTALLAEQPNIVTESRQMNYFDVIDLIDDIKGFDVTTATQLADGMKPFRIWLKKMPCITTTTKKPKLKLASKKLAGQYVVFTKVRDADLEAAIAANGGEVGDSTSKMTALITKDVNDVSAKLNAARAKNVPIFTITSFRKKFGI